MSENQLTYGKIAVLRSPISKYKRDEVADLFNEAGYELNYEGTLAIDTTISDNLVDKLGLTKLPIDDNYSNFIMKMDEINHPIFSSSIRKFIDIWYNGSDSYHSMLTLKEFTKEN